MALVFDDRYQPREESAEALQRLFDVCFDSADAFSLSRAAWARQDHTLERALEPYVLRRLRTTRWFCYYTANSNPQRIALYPLPVTLGVGRIHPTNVDFIIMLGGYQNVRYHSGRNGL